MPSRDISNREWKIFEFEGSVSLNDAHKYITEHGFYTTTVSKETPKEIARQFSMQERKGYYKLLTISEVRKDTPDAK